MLLFCSKNYNDALQKFDKLSPAVDPLRIAHNKAVCEFYKSDSLKCEQFRKSLTSLQNPDLTLSTVEIKNASLCPIYYNQAVLLFHMKQPYSALKITKAILQHMELLDKKLLEKVGLLASCLYLDTNQARKADELLSILTNKLEINNDDILTDDPLEIEAGRNKPALDDEQEAFRNLFRLVLIRSHLLNRKMITVPGEETSNFSILKAHQFYIGIDFQMASRELAKQFKNQPITVLSEGEDQNVCIANNMGLIHFSVKHYALAVRFFQQALLFDQKAIETLKSKYGNQAPLHCLGATKRAEILYNLGIALLYLQRPKDAFDCLIIPLNIYHKNPKLWLRLAEACIMVHRQNVKEQENQNKNIVSSVIGSGIHRKFIITPAAQKYVDEPGSSAAIPSANLEFASLCLRNALTLINYYSNLVAEGMESDLGIFASASESIPCNPSSPLNRDSIEKLKLHILTAASYVALQLGDYTMTLQHAKALLKMENIPDTHKMLGILYGAEASIMLERVSDAICFLDPNFLGGLKSEEFLSRASPDWKVNSIEAANAIMDYNRIVSIVILGDLDIARERIGKLVRHPIILQKLKMLELYLELQAGNIDNCKKMIAAEHQF